MEVLDKGTEVPAHSSKEYNAEYRKKNAAKIYEYNKAYRAERRDWRRKIDRAWQRKNKDKLSAASKRYYYKNVEQKREAARLYSKENPDVVNSAHARYRAAKRSAIPVWSNKERCREIYREAARLTEETGVQHEVDHIVPLRSKIVCGLHVESNLQIIHKIDNIRKGNRHWPDMP